MYLTQLDFSNHQRESDLTVLTDGGNNRVLAFAIDATVSEMRSFLKARYDVDAIFIEINDWDSAKQYVEGDQIIIDNGGNLEYYIAIQDSLNQDPLTQPSYWKNDDSRNALLVMYGIDICVYHMYAKVPNRQTPDDVNDRYLDAKEWLKGVNKGKYKPDLPELSDTTTPAATTRWGSSTKINSDW